MKKILLTLLILYPFTSLSSQKTLKIGIILPIEHQALTDIAQGFKDFFSKHYKGEVSYDVQNAQGDINLQQAIIKNMVSQKVDLMVPIATHTAQMTIKRARRIPVVTLAARVTEAERTRHTPVNVTGVLDEVPPLHVLSFLKQLKPNIKHLTLIHSASDKIMEEVIEAKSAAKELGLTIQPLMIPTLADLPPMAKSIDPNTDAIYILKDNLVASGIPMLKKIARKQGVLLVTSDEGTVKSGAPLGVGVTEYDIGQEGAKRALSALNGTPLKALPIHQMSELKVFLNPATAKDFGLEEKHIGNTAKTKGYQIQYITGDKS